MAWLAVDKDNTAYLYRTKPYREGEQWKCNSTHEIPFPVLPIDLSSVYMWLNNINIGWNDEAIEL